MCRAAIRVSTPSPTIDAFTIRIRPFLSFQLPSGTNPYDGLREVLGLESIEIFELIVIIESVAECGVPPEDVPAIDSLADAFEYYWKCVPKREG